MLLIDFSCEYQILVTPGLLPVRLDSCDCLLHIAIVGEVNLQGFLLSPLGGVCPVTFGRFLHTIDIRVLSPAYPNLLEVVAILTVVQGIDGKNLLPLDLGQSQYGSYLIVSVLELGLV